jgi:hypothetical protein
MNEHNINQNKQAETGDVELRLRAYYGPPLSEQPLPPASWQYVRHRLGVQASAGCRRGFRLRLPRKRSRAFVPTAMQDAFARIASEAGVPSTRAMLRCRLTSHVHESAVRDSWLGRRTIRLTLPLDAVMTMGQDELDVLLATGLARSISARTSTYTLGCLLLAGLVLLACLTLIVGWMHHVLPVGIPLALAMCAVVGWCWQRQARSLAFHADTLMVRWLGRGPACSGLHALAEHSRAPRRRRWGEPSLVERIERVCGTHVEARENRLTLVG